MPREVITGAPPPTSLDAREPREPGRTGEPGRPGTKPREPQEGPGSLRKLQASSGLLWAFRPSLGFMGFLGLSGLSKAFQGFPRLSKAIQGFPGPQKKNKNKTNTNKSLMPEALSSFFVFVFSAFFVLKKNQFQMKK